VLVQDLMHPLPTHARCCCDVPDQRARVVRRTDRRMEFGCGLLSRLVTPCPRNANPGNEFSLPREFFG
jgi:hypothetical protein